VNFDAADVAEATFVSLVTVTSMVPALRAGLVTVIDVDDVKLMVAALVPPNFTVATVFEPPAPLQPPAGKLVPVMVTEVPPAIGPPDTDRPVTVAAPLLHAAEASGASTATTTGATMAIAVAMEIVMRRNAPKRRPRSSWSTVSRVTPAN